MGRDPMFPRPERRGTPPSETVRRSCEENTRNVIAGIGVDDDEQNALGCPSPQVGDRHIAQGLRVVEPLFGISFDELRHFVTVGMSLAMRLGLDGLPAIARKCGGPHARSI